MLSARWTTEPSSDPDQALADLEKALVARAVDLAPEVVREPDGTVHVSLHPAAGPVVLVRDDRRVVVSADTGTAGPGYHEEVLSLLAGAAADAGLVWAEAPEPASREAIEERLDAWLGAMAREIGEAERSGATGFSILLPEGVEYAHSGLVATPLGPRDRAWLDRVARTPSAGRDVFAWWESGRGAHFHAGLARALAWTEARWRAPLDAHERTLLDRIVTALERAHGLDPTLELPWIEAAEIYELLGESSLRATRAGVLADAARKRGGRASIGYRRGAVRVTLSGGWSLVVPGDLAERWEEHGTWVGWDRERTIWVSSMRAEGTTESAEVLAGLPELPGEGDLLRMERGPIVGHARFAAGEDEGKAVVVMRAHAACGPHVALGTFILPENADRTWALETWGTLDREVD